MTRLKFDMFETKRMERVFRASDSLSNLWPANKYFTYSLMASNKRRLTGDLGNRGGEYDDWHRRAGK